MSTSRLFALGKWAASLALCASFLPAHASTSACTFKPSVGQAGKDVVWVPTPDALVERMLRMAQVTPEDFVVDLGSGDGKIVIMAAQRFKAQGRGIEYNPDMVELSRCLAREAGVVGMTRFDQGDIFKSDFSQASVVTMYLLQELNLRLRPTLFRMMKPGTRVVSHQFTMGEWQADETSTVDGKSLYYWVIPANAGGTWRISWRGDAGETGGDLSIEQTFQNIEGRVRFGGLEAGLRVPRLRGEHISFDLMDGQGVLRTFTGRVRGDRIEGTAVGPQNQSVAFTAVRRGLAPPIRGTAN
jgi:hypothetical protein